MTADALRLTRQDVVLAALCAGVSLALYLGFTEHIFQFDGVLFAGFLRDSIRLGVPPAPFPKHFLFLPSFFLLGSVLDALGFEIADATYRMVQVCAGLCVATLNGLFFLLVRRLGARGLLALALTGVMAFARVHWERGLEGQTYVFGQFFAALALGYASRVLVRPDAARVVALGVLSALPMLFHVSQLMAVLGIFGAYLWAGGPRRLQFAALHLGVAGVASAVGPVLGLGLYDPDKFSQALLASTNATAFHTTPFFLYPSWTVVWNLVLGTFARCFVAFDRADTAAVVVLGALLLACHGALMVVAVRGLRSRWATVRLAVIPWLCAAPLYVLLYSVATPGWTHNWEVVLLSWMVVLAAGLATARRALPTVVLALACGGYNLAVDVLPISSPAFNAPARMAAEIGSMTPETTLYLATGGNLGQENMMKAYLGYFGHRSAVGLDMVLASAPPAERVARTRRILQGMLLRHGTLHVSSLMFSQEMNQQFARDFGLPVHGLADFFSAYACLRVAQLEGFDLVAVAVAPDDAAVAALAEFHAEAGRAETAAHVADPAQWQRCNP